MMPRKKLEYYARQYGVEGYAKVKLTDEQCASICKAVGSKVYGTADCGGSISTLIDCVMDDDQFVKAHTSDKARGDFIAMRIADYAANAVFKAYSELIARARILFKLLATSLSVPPGTGAYLPRDRTGRGNSRSRDLFLWVCRNGS